MAEENDILNNIPEDAPTDELKSVVDSTAADAVNNAAVDVSAAADTVNSAAADVSAVADTVNNAVADMNAAAPSGSGSQNVGYSDAVLAGMQNAQNIQNAAGSVYNGINGAGSPVMQNDQGPAMQYNAGARPNPFDNMQAQNPYTQGNPYANMQGGMNAGARQNPFDNMQGGANPYFQGTPETPESGKPAKKKMPKGKKIGIISGIVVFVAALVVCGLIFIPKLLKPKKETIKKAFKSTQTSLVEGNTIVNELGLADVGNNIKNNGGKVVIKATNPSNKSEKVDFSFDLDCANKEGSFTADVNVNGINDIFKGYINSDRAYITADKNINGYYYIDFATAASEFMNSYVFSLGSSYNSSLSPLSGLGISTGALSQEQTAQLKELFTKLKDSIDYSKDGSKTLTLGGHKYDTTKYVMTIPKKELQNAASEAVDILMSSVMGGSSNSEYYGAMISSYISTIFNQDVKINLYICDDRVVAMDTGYEIDLLGNKAGISFNAQFEGQDDLFSALDGSLKITAGDKTMEIQLNYDSYETASGSEVSVSLKFVSDGDISRQMDFIISYDRETSDIMICMKTPEDGMESTIYGKVLSLEKGKKLEIQFDTRTDKNTFFEPADVTTEPIDVFVGIYSDFTVEKVSDTSNLVNFLTPSEEEFKSILSQDLINELEKNTYGPIEYDEWDFDYDEPNTEATEH